MIFIESERHRADGYVLLRVTGEVDVETAPRLAQELDFAAGVDPALLVVVDLREVRFFSAAGVHSLSGWVRAPGDRVRLVCDDTSPVITILRALGLHERWPVQADIDPPAPRRGADSGIRDGTRL